MRRFAALALLVGGVLGSALGIPAAVHLANGRRGDLSHAALLSLAIAGVAVTGLAIAENEMVFLVVAVPLAQILTSVSIERSTTVPR